MRDIKIFCDKCGEEIVLNNGSQKDLSGWIVTIHKNQIGSISTYHRAEVCDKCCWEIQTFISKNPLLTVLGTPV